MANNVINTFIDFDELPAQVSGQKYGPASETVFRSGAVFTLSAESMAFAVTEGMVLIQPQDGNNDKINLILKPVKILANGLPRVKYFIYRGLKRTDFLNNQVLSASGTSEYISRIHTDYNKAGGQAAPSTARIGFDLFSAQGTMSLDSCFYESRLDTNNEPVVLSIVKQGDTLHPEKSVLILCWRIRAKICLWLMYGVMKGV